MAALLATVLAATLAGGLDRALAIISSTITIDGVFSDWVGVRSDPANVARDSQIPDDPDYPAEADRDVYLISATYDSDYVYLAWRRTAGGQKAITFGAYIDTSGDGLLQDGEPVVLYTVGTGNPYCAQGWILDYHQARDTVSGPMLYPAGDPMGRDGDTPDGWARWQDGYRPPTRALDAYLAPNGIECEARVSWEDLGLAPGSPIAIHFASGNGESWGNPGKPSITWKSIGGGKYIEENRGQVEDNVDEIWWLRDAGVSVTPDHVRGGAAGTVVTYTHAVSNLGNRAATFDLTSQSSAGWPTEVLSEGGEPLSSLALAAGATSTILVRVTIPPGTIDGAMDVNTLVATAQSDPDVRASATDTTLCGRVTVSPDQRGTIAPGQTIEYSFVVRNSMNATGTFDLTYQTTQGLPVVLVDGTGTPVSSVTLDPGGLTTVVARIAVPAGAEHGTQDVTSVYATLTTDPTVQAHAKSTTTVRDGLDITPDNVSSGGASTYVSYRHTITNSWPTTRTVGVAADSSNGWPVTILADDGLTPLSSIVLGPYGASREVVVRVAIPGTATDGLVDVTTVTASSGGVNDTARDTTTVRRLTLYDSPGFSHECTEYLRGDTVFSRATGLTPGGSVYFVWKNPLGAIVRTSAQYKVDTEGMSFDEYALDGVAPIGAWTCELHDSKGGSLLESVRFNVGFDAEIARLSATDAATIGAATTVTSDLANHGGSAIVDSSALYRIWWDSNSDGTFNAGDLYIDDAGAPHTYSGGVAPWTHTTTGISVAGPGTWSDPGWTVSSSQFPNQGTYNVTEIWLASDGSTVIDTALTQFFSVPTVGEWFAGLGVPSLPVIALFGFVWAGAVFHLRSRRAWLSFYVLGSLGCVVLVLFVAQALGLDTRLEAIEAVQVAWLADVFNIRVSLLPPSGLAIGNHVGWGVFDIGIECSALLEMAAFAALVGFYPPWRAGRKAMLIAAGVAATYVVNLLRILIIVGMISRLGTDWVFIAHAVVGRVFFFAGVITIFWFLVTMPTVRTLSARLEGSHG